MFKVRKTIAIVSSNLLNLFLMKSTVVSISKMVNAYIDFLTDANPKGEVRGQLSVI